MHQPERHTNRRQSRAIGTEVGLHPTNKPTFLFLLAPASILCSITVPFLSALYESLVILGNSLSTATMLWAGRPGFGCRLSQGFLFSSRPRPDRLWSPKGTRGSFPLWKGAEAWSWLLTST